MKKLKVSPSLRIYNFLDPTFQMQQYKTSMFINFLKNISLLCRGPKIEILCTHVNLENKQIDCSEINIHDIEVSISAGVSHAMPLKCL